MLFVLVAGHFFYALSGNFSYAPFLKNKALNVVAPYAFVSFPAAMIYVLGLKHEHQWLDMEWFTSLHYLWRYVYLMFMGAHLGPLWFIPMILVYYLMSPLWVWLIKVDKIHYVLVAFLLLSMYVGRAPDNSNFIQSGIYYLPAYLLGMYLGRHPDVVDRMGLHAQVGFWVSLLVLLSLGGCYAYGITWKVPVALVFGCYLICICKQKLNHRQKWLDLFARLSFYLFFVHGYVTGFFRSALKSFDHYAWEPVLVLFVFATTLLLCLAAYIPLKMLLRERSKYLIGA